MRKKLTITASVGLILVSSLLISGTTGASAISPQAAKAPLGLKGISGGTLPSGRKASADVIRSLIENGGAGMPPFKTVLSEKEREDVIAYVMTL